MPKLIEERHSLEYVRVHLSEEDVREALRLYAIAHIKTSAPYIHSELHSSAPAIISGYFPDITVMLALSEKNSSIAERAEG
jgi:hypothetical protein